jgi:pyrroline-5-carboxylate reductase
MKILEILGDTFEVDEQKLNAYAVFSAVARIYIWFHREALADIDEQIGLENKESYQAVLQASRAALDIQFHWDLNHEPAKDVIPVKPICDHEQDSKDILNQKLIGLHQKIKP